MKLLKKIDGFFLKNSEGNFLTCMALNTQIIGDAEYYFNSQSDISIENLYVTGNSNYYLFIINR